MRNSISKHLVLEVYASGGLDECKVGYDLDSIPIFEFVQIIVIK